MDGACNGDAVIPGRCETSNPESRDSGSGASHHPGMTDSPIQIPVPPKNPLLVEIDPAVTRQISLDVGPRRNAVAQANQSRNVRLERLHALWKSVAQSLHDLEQREVDIGQAAA